MRLTNVFLGAVPTNAWMMGTTRPTAEVTARPAAAVVEAVATAEGWAPADVPEPLYESVDPDALEALVASVDRGRITFTYLGYEVTVDADGTVTLAE
jgi:hypothetical protein